MTAGEGVFIHRETCLAIAMLGIWRSPSAQTPSANRRRDGNIVLLSAGVFSFSFGFRFSVFGFRFFCFVGLVCFPELPAMQANPTGKAPGDKR